MTRVAVAVLFAAGLLQCTEGNGSACAAAFQAARDLEDDRVACTEACNAAGYCCTTNTGGCGQLTCSAGCHIAWYAASEAACIAECTEANGQCTWQHSDGTEFRNCFGYDTCGCPSTPVLAGSPWGSGNDCSATACAKGCQLASNVFGHSFYSRVLSAEEQLSRQSQFDADEAVLAAALADLKAHVNDVTVMDESALSSAKTTVEAHRKLLKFNSTLIQQAMDLIDAYEASASHGPLFSAAHNPNGFSRAPSPNDGHATDRALLAVHQALIDDVYNWPGLLAECNRGLFEGRAWLTADFYPGAAPPPADPAKVYAIAFNATVPRVWGHPTGYSMGHARRPTGLYLSPGQLVRVSVPESLVDTGYQVLVGSHTHDNGIKDRHLRMDRVTVSQAITAVDTLVGNPLGGGVYILVPYLADLGQVSVNITGGVVPSPLFQRTGVRRMTDDEWLTQRTAPGPWADFETDNFMLNVPSSWVYLFEGPTSLLDKYDLAMEGTAEMFGYPPAYRHGGVHTLYLQPDRHIAHPAYGTGYPQVNNLWDPRQTYNGNHSHWFLRDPLGWPTCWHELGHSQQRQDLTFQYRGETEAIVNFLYTYVAHVKFGVDFNTAFNMGMGHSNYEPDDAAVHWMITPNFRDGNEMDHSNTELDEFRYQHRGYGKYADIVRLFGWETFTAFYHKEQQDKESNLGHDMVGYNFGLASEQSAWPDVRTLRWSVAAGFDLRPLIHAWGIHPVNHSALGTKMMDMGLVVSERVRCLLLRYRELIPADNAAFNVFFEKIHPGRPSSSSDDPRYGRGWYNVWRDTYSAADGAKAKAALTTILELYYGNVTEASCLGVESGQGSVLRPASYAWMGDMQVTTSQTSTSTSSTVTTATMTRSSTVTTATTNGSSTVTNATTNGSSVAANDTNAGSASGVKVGARHSLARLAVCLALLLCCGD